MEQIPGSVPPDEHHVELSEISDYMKCPRKHWFRYRLGLRGARDYGYLRFHRGIYAAMGVAAQEWNVNRRALADHAGCMSAFGTAWSNDPYGPRDGRDLYRCERAAPALAAFLIRLDRLAAEGSQSTIVLRPTREVALQLPRGEDGTSEREVRITWSAGHCEVDGDGRETAVFLHKFSRRKASHLTQADHPALTLLPESCPGAAVGIWYLLLGPEPDLVDVNPKSVGTCKGKVSAAALGILASRGLPLDAARPPRCENDDTCRSCAYRFNCFDGED